MTNLSRPIVVAVADKQHGALAYAVVEGNRSHREIRVVHAYDVLPSALSRVGAAGVIAGYEAGGQDVLNAAHDYVESLEPSTPVRYELFRGKTAEVLTVESDHAAELIIGPDDSPWLVRLFQGAITRRLIQDATCPVVVVPSTWLPGAVEQQIVVCIDVETPALEALNYAFSTADARNAPLRVLHVEAASTAGKTIDVPTSEFSQLLDTCRDTYPQVPVETSVIEGDALAISRDLTHSVGLLIAGRPRVGRTSILQRSFAARLVESAGCPVVIVPSTDSNAEI